MHDEQIDKIVENKMKVCRELILMGIDEKTRQSLIAMNRRERRLWIKKNLKGSK